VKTCWFIVVHSMDSWWVDCEGKSYGPFDTSEEATATAVRLAGVFGDPTRQAQIWAPAPSGDGHRLVWSAGPWPLDASSALLEDGAPARDDRPDGELHAEAWSADALDPSAAPAEEHALAGAWVDHTPHLTTAPAEEEPAEAPLADALLVAALGDDATAAEPSDDMAANVPPPADLDPGLMPPQVPVEAIAEPSIEIAAEDAA